MGFRRPVRDHLHMVLLLMPSSCETEGNASSEESGSPSILRNCLGSFSDFSPLGASGVLVRGGMSLLHLVVDGAKTKTEI